MILTDTQQQARAIVPGHRDTLARRLGRRAQRAAWQARLCLARAL